MEKILREDEIQVWLDGSYEHKTTMAIDIEE